MYAWNGFVLLTHNRTCLTNYLTCAWLELAKVEDGKGSSHLKGVCGVEVLIALCHYTDQNPYYHDDWCVVKVMQGVCFSGLDRLDEAISCFTSVIKRFVWMFQLIFSTTLPSSLPALPYPTVFLSHPSFHPLYLFPLGFSVRTQSWRALCN